MQTHSPERGWEEATKERADLGVGARVHSSMHSFTHPTKHRRCWALGWAVRDS